MDRKNMMNEQDLEAVTGGTGDTRSFDEVWEEIELKYCNFCTRTREHDSQITCEHGKMWARGCYDAGQPVECISFIRGY